MTDRLAPIRTGLAGTPRTGRLVARALLPPAGIGHAGTLDYFGITLHLVTHALGRNGIEVSIYDGPVE